MKKYSKTCLLICAAFAVMALSAFTNARHFTPAVPPYIKQNVFGEAGVKPDKKIIEELMEVMRQADATSENFFMEARFSAFDALDTAHDIKNMPFVMFRRGSDLYTSFGSVEMINNASMYLLVDHDKKKMLITRAKQTPEAPVPSLKMLLTMIEKEGFSVHKNISGGDVTISLENPNHISFKKYVVRYSTSSKQIRSIQTVTTESADFMNATTFRTTNMELIDAGIRPEKSVLADTKRFVHLGEKSVSAERKYKHYEIILM